QAAMTNPLLRGLVALLRPLVHGLGVLTASLGTVIMPADLPTLQRSPMPRQRLSSTERYGTSWPKPLRLDADGLDHLRPLFSFLVSIQRSAGEPASTVPPRSASRALSLGSARPTLTSLLSVSTISAGVAFGAPTPDQVLAP